jgi:hypothetical protein
MHVNGGTSFTGVNATMLLHRTSEVPDHIELIESGG